MSEHRLLVAVFEMLNDLQDIRFDYPHTPARLWPASFLHRRSTTAPKPSLPLAAAALAAAALDAAVIAAALAAAVHAAAIAAAAAIAIAALATAVATAACPASHGAAIVSACRSRDPRMRMSSEVVTQRCVQYNKACFSILRMHGTVGSG